MADHITRYDKMPIPAIAAHTSYFDAGVIRIGVELRELTDEVVAAIRHTLQGAGGDEPGQLEGLEDSGVSLHVYGRLDGIDQEYLRFDCFREDPHYHYVSWKNSTNEVLHIDPVADGDPLVWALDKISHRLVQMLVRAEADEVAAKVDSRLLEAAMPQVAAAAYAVRFQLQG